MGTPLKVTIVMQSRLQKHGSFEDFVVFLARKARQLGWKLSFVFPKIITQQVRFLLEEQGAAVYEVDAVLWFEATNMHMRSSGTTNGIQAIDIGNQTERSNFTPVNEYRYWDDVVIGDAYIGPQVPPP